MAFAADNEAGSLETVTKLAVPRIIRNGPAKSNSTPKSRLNVLKSTQVTARLGDKLKWPSDSLGGGVVGIMGVVLTSWCSFFGWGQGLAYFGDHSGLFLAPRAKLIYNCFPVN